MSGNHCGTFLKYHIGYSNRIMNPLTQIGYFILEGPIIVIRGKGVKTDTDLNTDTPPKVTI